MRRLLCAAVCAVALSGCAYQAPVAVTPNLNVYSSYGDKLPGTYALYVSSEGLNEVVKPTGYQCSAHSYPLDLTSSFKSSVVKTVQQLVENVEVVDGPLSSDELARTGKRGMIVVRGDTIDARVQFIPGFWSASATSQVEISANMTVDTASGRVLGTTAEGSGNAESDGGQLCGGGANAVGFAAEKALKQLLGQLGERLSNSPRLRADIEPPQAAKSGDRASDSDRPSNSGAKSCGAIPSADGVRIVPCPR